MDEQNTPTDLTTDLAGLSDEALDEALADARAEAADLTAIPAEEVTDDQIARMEALGDFIDSVGSEQDNRAQVAAERAERATAAAQRLQGDDGEPGDGEESGDEGDGDDDGEEEVPAPGSEGEQAPQAVAAAARVPAPRPRQPRTPARQSQARSQMTIVASAETGFNAGHTFATMAEATQAFINRSRPFNSMRPSKGAHLQYNVLGIERNLRETADGLHLDNPDYPTFQALLAAAVSEKRLPGGSLASHVKSLAAAGHVAAGGWCAPSETLYGLTADETLDGIIDLPTVGINRGGLSYTLGPDFADIYTNAGFAQTEAEAIAGTTKPCVEVDCPDFDEVRLDAVGICVKAPLLTRTAYPEVIERWLTGTVVANQHKVAARLIASMRTALGTALAPTLTGTPLSWGLLSIMEWNIEMQRQAYRLSENETLEVVVPRWLRVAIRADLANRAGVGASSVTNAQIAQHFADRGARVQWILNYQEVATPLTSVAFPATVEMMVYPAGTFVKGTADVISLDTVYDVQDLQTNVYTAAFVEDGVLLAKMKHGGARITVPVNANGMMGSLQIDDNIFTAQAETQGAAAA